MGKCLSNYRRVEHFDPTMSAQQVYDKFGNLISGGTTTVEIFYRDRSLKYNQSI